MKDESKNNNRKYDIYFITKSISLLLMIVIILGLIIQALLNIDFPFWIRIDTLPTSYLYVLGFSSILLFVSIIVNIFSRERKVFSEDCNGDKKLENKVSHRAEQYATNYSNKSAENEDKTESKCDEPPQDYNIILKKHIVILIAIVLNIAALLILSKFDYSLIDPNKEVEAKYTNYVLLLNVYFTSINVVIIVTSMIVLLSLFRIPKFFDDLIDKAINAILNFGAVGNKEYGFLGNFSKLLVTTAVAITAAISIVINFDPIDENAILGIKSEISNTNTALVKMSDKVGRIEKSHERLSKLDYDALITEVSYISDVLDLANRNSSQLNIEVDQLTDELKVQNEYHFKYGKQALINQSDLKNSTAGMCSSLNKINNGIKNLNDPEKGINAVVEEDYSHSLVADQRNVFEKMLYFLVGERRKKPQSLKTTYQIGNDSSKVFVSSNKIYIGRQREDAPDSLDVNNLSMGRRISKFVLSKYSLEPEKR